MEQGSAFCSTVSYADRSFPLSPPAPFLMALKGTLKQGFKQSFISDRASDPELIKPASFILLRTDQTRFSKGERFKK